MRKNGRSGRVLGLVAAVVGAVACFLLAVGSVGAIASPHSSPTAVLAVLAGAFTIALILLMRLAIHLEHELRGSPRAASSHVTADAPPFHPPRRHPKNGPASRIFAVVLAVAFLAFAVFASVEAHARSARSAFTQHHGVIRSAVVTTVHRIHHSSKSSSYNTYDYDVQLSVPVDGTTTTRVHDPARNYRDYFVDDQLTVLVDPRQLSYAEIPGRPDASSYWWVAPVVFGSIFLVWGALVAGEMYRHRRHQRPVKTPRGALVSTPWPTD